MQNDNIVHIVDPDAAIGEALSALLGTYNIDVQPFPDAESFLAARRGWAADRGCVLTEAVLPGQSGLTLVRTLRAEGYVLPVIVITNALNRGVQQQALAFGATDVLEKPFMNLLSVERLSSMLPEHDRPLFSDATEIALANGTTITFRTMRRGGEESDLTFVRSLAASCRHVSFPSAQHAQAMDTGVNAGYPENYALIATCRRAGGDQPIGSARFISTTMDGVAGFEIAVSEQWQDPGIATHLIHGLTAAAAIAGLRSLKGHVAANDRRTLELITDLGFTVDPPGGDLYVSVSKDLRCTTR